MDQLDTGHADTLRGSALGAFRLMFSCRKAGLGGHSLRLGAKAPTSALLVEDRTVPAPSPGLGFVSGS